MPDTNAYEYYENIPGCNQCFTVGTGNMQPDSITFGATGPDDWNTIKIGDIRYNSWWSEDILKIYLNGLNANPIDILDYGLKPSSSFEIYWGEGRVLDGNILNAGEVSTGFDLVSN